MKPKAEITLTEVMPLVREYYFANSHRSGGDFHIVLEDGNIEDSHIEWCQETARRQDDQDGVRLGEMLLKLSSSQRHRMYKRLHEGDDS